MSGFIGKFLLFMAGQKLVQENSMPEHMKRNLITLAALGVASLVFFAQSMAALLVAVYFSFTVLVGLENYYAALATSGVALLVSLVFAATAKGILKKGQEKEKKKSLLGLSANDVKSLALAFAEGFMRGRNWESKSGDNVKPLYRKKQ